MEDLIAAIATGPVKSAVGIIRLSGEGAILCAAKIFRPLSGKPFGTGAPRRMVLGEVLNSAGSVTDQALAVFFCGPNSYTGEDMVELHCHGSPTVLAMTLELLCRNGARRAKEGEFTRRAFLNGKLDLTQAEAVADLIDAQTPAAAKQAAGQLGGELSRRIEGVYNDLTDLLAHFHVLVDYPDEDLEPMDEPQIVARLAGAEGALQEMLAGYRRVGRHLRGIPTAIVGLPNAGKSSLLNALLGYERAIVTDIPGTTRDTVEETCQLGRNLLRLTDTAGLRETGDTVERLGVERSREAMANASLILVVLDLSREATAEDVALVRQAVATEQAETILVLNKMDLPTKLEWTDELDLACQTPVSAKTGEGLAELVELIDSTFRPGEGEAVFFTNARQAAAAQEAVKCLGQAIAALERGMPPDGPLSDVELAMAALGELTGRNIQEDVVDRIFSRFCVGK